jgi:hypothetical protein
MSMSFSIVPHTNYTMKPRSVVLNQNTVKISVCIPAYNRVEVLPELLDSILSQDKRELFFQNLRDHALISSSIPQSG